MKLSIQKGINQKVILQAMQQIELVNNKTIKPKRLNISGSKKWCSLNVGIRYRVLIKRLDENGQVLIASLLHHESYNHHIKR